MSRVGRIHTYKRRPKVSIIATITKFRHLLKLWWDRRRSQPSKTLSTAIYDRISQSTNPQLRVTVLRWHDMEKVIASYSLSDMLACDKFTGSKWSKWELASVIQYRLGRQTLRLNNRSPNEQTEQFLFLCFLSSLSALALRLFIRAYTPD